MPDKPQVFVIMPFAAEFQDVYTDLVKEPLENAGFGVTRADTLLNQVNILQDVVRGIADAELVVADVTGLNGNVLYELGLAHALGKRTVMITQKLEELPFDLRPYRATEYSMNFKRAGDLAKFLEDLGRNVLKDQADFSNPVQDYAPNALSHVSQVSKSPRRREASEPAAGGDVSETGVDTAEPEAGLLEHIVHMQTASDRISEIAAEISAKTGGVGRMMQMQTHRMERAQNSLGDRAAGALLTIARDTGGELNKYADDLAPLVSDLREALSSLAVGANAVARARHIDSQTEADQIVSEIESLRSLETSTHEAVEGIGGFASNLFELPNMERKLTVASRRAAGVVTETAEVLQSSEAEFARARGLLEERLREYERAAR